MCEVTKPIIKTFFGGYVRISDKERDEYMDDISLIYYASQNTYSAEYKLRNFFKITSDNGYVFVKNDNLVSFLNNIYIKSSRLLRRKYKIKKNKRNLKFICNKIDLDVCGLTPAEINDIIKKYIKNRKKINKKRKNKEPQIFEFYM